MTTTHDPCPGPRSLVEAFNRRDPLGLRGCGFFHIVAGQIAFQRGYWDELMFLRLHGLPVPGAQ